MGFCSVSDIEFLTRVDYDSNTVPTDSQIEEWIDIFSNEIENKLTEKGISIPISTDKFYSTLRKVVSFAVAGVILRQNNNEDNLGSYYFEQYKLFIEEIDNGKYNNQKTAVSSNQVIDGTENSDSIKYNEWENDYDY